MSLFTLPLALALASVNCANIIGNSNPLEGLNCAEQKVFLQTQIESCSTCEQDSDCTVGPIVCTVTPCYGAVIAKNFDEVGYQTLGDQYIGKCFEHPIACACQAPTSVRCLTGKCVAVE